MESTCTNSPRRVRCVNLDWLEVDCLEPASGNDPDYFASCGIGVVVRDYGTRVYRQMFTILDDFGNPLLEVRRLPATSVLHPNDCHLRLVNRTCYFDNAADLMAEFMNRHGYIFNRIARVDICLDFEKFDEGDLPKNFLLRYLDGTYSKINQANISAHGSDTWNGRDWNSISWGSPTSDIGTKMYDKTLELYDPSSKSYKKPYIRQAWLKCGLIDDIMTCTKTNAEGKIYKPRIWRIEFSIRSSVKNWFLIRRNGRMKEKQSIRNLLEMYNSREKICTLFASLSQHYFHFKHYIEGQRKDRCPDKVLFKWKDLQSFYKVAKVVSDTKPNKPLLSLLGKIRDYRESHIDKQVHDACNILIRCIEDENYRYTAGSHFTHEEITALQTALKYKATGDNEDVAVLLRNIKALLHLNDKTAIF